MDYMRTRQIPESDPRVIEKLAHRSTTSTPLFRSSLSLSTESLARLKKLESEKLAVEEKLTQKSVSNSDQSEYEHQLHRIQRLEILYTIQTETIIDDFHHFLTASIRSIVAKNKSSAELFVCAQIKNMCMVKEPNRTELLRLAGNGVGDIDLKKLLNISNSVPLDTLIEMALIHSDSFSKYEQEFNQFAEECRNDFKNTIEQSVRSGRLPQSALSNLSRIASIPIILIDRLLPEHINSRSLGTHSINSGVRIFSDHFIMDNRQQVRKTIFHELLHAISGLSFTLHEIPTLSGTKNITTSRKTGITLHGVNSSYSPFRWLNEAVTEKLALELSAYNEDNKLAYEGSVFYMREREELSRLLASGISFDVFTNAFFENFSYTQTKTEKGVHFRNMIHAINAVHGKHAFTSLENQHRFEHEIETILDRHWFMPENSLIEDPSIAEKDAKFHTVQISVGVNTETKYTRRLVHTSFAFSKMKDAPSLEEQWQKAQKTLANIQSAFGRKVEIKIVKNHEKLSVA